MTETKHTWSFFRSGGLDQVILSTSADLLHLDELDQKLWVALSCPVKGLELDERTLALIDTNADGFIRVPEVLAAVKWAGDLLREPADLLRGGELPLGALKETPAAQAIVAAARGLLVTNGRADAASVAVADFKKDGKIFVPVAPNGVAVLRPEATDNAADQALIKDILACLGPAPEASGTPGISAKQIEEFFGEIKSYVEWIEQSSAREIAVLGEGTDAAVAALRTVRTKVEDFFARCRLAAYDGRALAALNRSENDYLAFAAKDLAIGSEEVAAFPLARIVAGRALPLADGVNPAWAARLAALQKFAVAPLLGAEKRELSDSEWNEVNAKFAAYETWLGSKKGSRVEKLGPVRVRELFADDRREALLKLLTRDLERDAGLKALSDAERLTHYYRDLRTLLHNFVNFSDFYSPTEYATFQAGLLYLDSRCTELCVRVAGPSPLAAMSKACIAYLDCKRGGEAMKIAACFPQGDSDFLFVGRNGIFYDRQGRDWNATITSLVDNPISLRQAFWSPYKKFIRMIEEQVAKRAAAAEAAGSSKLAHAAEAAANVDKTHPDPKAAPKKVDVGTVAALGVAFGAIAGAISSIALGLARLEYWQLPFVLLAVMLVISLPSVIIAAIKLHQRTLGPLLEATGWAINGRVKINIPFGTKLTQVAKLPPDAHRSLADPYEDKDAKRRKVLLWLLLIALVAAAGAIRWDRVQRGHYFWQKPVVVAEPVLAPADVPAPAPQG